MTDETQPAATVSAASDIAASEKELHGNIADLQAQLAAALDAKSVTEKALQSANAQLDRNTETLKASNDDRAERSKVLLGSFEHAVSTNSPMTLAMVSELKALLAR